MTAYRWWAGAALFAVAIAWAPRTAVSGGVDVHGARALPASEVKRLVAGARPGDESGMQRALERVAEAYYRLGHLGARIDARLQSGDSTWAITIEEGAPATIAGASIAGVLSREPDELIARLGLEEGAPYQPGRIERRIREVLSEYDEGGQPFAQVWIDSVGYDAATDQVALKLYVVEGDARIIQRVDVEGLRKTRPHLAERISGIRTGQPYRASVLRDAYARLTASGVFTDVAYPTVRLSSDGRGVDAVLVVDEPERSHTFTSALGYAEAEGGEDRQVSGLVDLRLNNIGGTLRSVAALWSNDGRDRVETRIDYRDQFFLGRRVSFGVRLHQIGLDTLYTWQSIGVDVERPVGAMAVLAGLHGDRNVFSEGELRRSWRVRSSLGLSVRRGGAAGNTVAALARVTVARKRRIFREGGDRTLAQYIGEVETDAVVRLRPVLHLRNAFTYRGLESDEALVPLSERFYIGGARTLRGYKENQFNGRRVATARTELLLGRTRSENVYLFADAGYVLRETMAADGSVARDDLVRAGYGFGLRTRSRMGNVELSFGVGEKLSLQQTKVHVLLEQSF